MKTRPAQQPPSHAEKPTPTTRNHIIEVKARGRAGYYELAANNTLPTSPAQLLAEAYARFQIIEAGALAGDRACYHSMVAFVTRTCAHLENASLVNRSEQRRICRSREDWPALVSVHPEDRAATLHGIGKLPLAHNLPLAIRHQHPEIIEKRQRGKHRQTDVHGAEAIANAAVRQAFDALATIFPKRFNLHHPRVSQELLDDWRSEIMLFFLRIPDCDRYTYLHDIGLTEAGRKATRYPRCSAQYRTAIQKGIRQSLKKAFSRVFTVKRRTRSRGSNPAPDTRRFAKTKEPTKATPSGTANLPLKRRLLRRHPAPASTREPSAQANR